jgi:hypothetical protein
LSDEMTGTDVLLLGDLQSENIRRRLLNGENARRHQEALPCGNLKRSSSGENNGNAHRRLVEGHLYENSGRK